MKYDVISESQRGVNCKVGFCFAGLACELPLAILELSKRCPDCGGKLLYHYETNPIDEFSSERIAIAEQCDCGYALTYTDEPKSERSGV